MSQTPLCAAARPSTLNDTATSHAPPPRLAVLQPSRSGLHAHSAATGGLYYPPPQDPPAFRHTRLSPPACLCRAGPTLDAGITAQGRQAAIRPDDDLDFGPVICHIGVCICTSRRGAEQRYCVTSKGFYFSHAFTGGRAFRPNYFSRGMPMQIQYPRQVPRKGATSTTLCHLSCLGNR